MSLTNILTLENPVFKSYLFYSCILVLKVLLMAPLTARYRFAKKVFSNPEDYFLGPKPKTLRTDDDVERVRRAHLNDLENIPFFFVSAFAYVLTGPNPWLANTLFRSYTLARIAHTLVYAVVVVPQPARAIAFFIGIGIKTYMSVVAIKAFF
uniref:Microsomal glutathione S-transferase 1 n=1 Tax=Lygus hesperus TaxID=30085 RepID=A0A0A9YXL8_LYGHE